MHGLMREGRRKPVLYSTLHCAELRSKVVPTPAQKTTAGEGDCQHEHSKPVRMTWAWLLKRVLDIDIEQCACGGKLKLVAVIEAPDVLEKILTHLGLRACQEFRVCGITCCL